MTNILFIADVIGSPGRDVVQALLPGLRRRHDVHLVICNGENAAGGFGLTRETAAGLYGAGVDVLTGGNHTLQKREIYPVLAAEPRMLRPANIAVNAPGRGLVTVETAAGPVSVVNVMGSVFMTAAHSPFAVIDELVEEARRGAAVVLVDVHAEATSEKAALARWLDGRVTAVVGTHTHVQTSDARVLPRGTAFITDAGMTGPHDSVIGVESELAIRRMRTGMPVRFETAQGDVRIEGAVIDSDSESGMATAIESLRISVS
jgi:metallophosphoesterase (TIGR00282 family)